MIEIKSASEVIQFARQRAAIETGFARKMYDAFNTGELLICLRNFVALAIEQLVVIGQMRSSLPQQVAYNAGIKKAGGNLAIWRYSTKGESLDGLEEAVRRKGSWSAADCSDLIRLFGGVIEDTTLQGTLVDAQVDQGRKDIRTGGPDIWGSSSRSRKTDGYVATPSAPHITAGHLEVLSKKRDSGGFSGIEKVALKDGSTVKKIDFVFGLSEGCDISGTTADSIFFFKHVNTFISALGEAIPPSMIPVIQLLPMATMASQGHHTVLECALTLTLNKYIDYQVGFYSTILPRSGGNQALKAILDAAERHPYNRQLLCYWDTRERALRAIQYTGEVEISKLRSAVLADDAFLASFRTLPSKPSKTDLFSLPRFSNLPH